MKKFISIFVIALGVLGLTLHGHSSAPKVLKVTLEDSSINPLTAEYIIDGIKEADQMDAQALMLQLDTPGGLLSSTRLIVREMIDSPVPIIVYIAPGGARAGSAGVFITYASHVAAMAPSTNIGAAHPVQFGGGSDGPGNQNLKELLERLKNLEQKSENLSQKDSQESATEKIDETVYEDSDLKSDEQEMEDDPNPMSSKVLNDTVAFIKSLAKQHNRNIDWAVQSVVKSDSITEEEALEKKVVEFIANDADDLLRQIHGISIKVQGKQVVLDTKDAQIVEKPMSIREKILNILADPNVSYILMILGFYGLLYEITHPGIGVPGIMGLIFLILAFYSMQTLPTNYAGVALTVLGVILFGAEAVTPGVGLLLLGGIFSTVLGGMLLFDSADPVMRVSMSTIVAIGLLMGAILVLFLRQLFKMRNQPVMGGLSGMVGQHGMAEKDLPANETIKVFVRGETWNAISSDPLSKGDRFEVVDVQEGMCLSIRKLTYSEKI